MNLGDPIIEAKSRKPAALGQTKTLKENVSCEDLEKMTEKNVRDLKRARQFNLPKISKQHSPRLLEE